MADSDNTERVTPEVLDELDRLLGKSTPGDWKVWGMTVMADQDGTSNVAQAVGVARTVCTDSRGAPRTWDANLIALMQRSLPALIATARAAHVAEGADRG